MILFFQALRSHVAGFAGTTLVAVLLGIANTIGYVQIAGSDPQGRAIFAQQMEILGRQLSYLLPLPAQLDTLVGYLHWRHFGNLPLVYAFWALLSGTAAGRGDEERGLIEQWLASGVARWHYVVTRAIGFAVIAAASLGFMLAGVAVGAFVGGEALAPRALGTQAVALWALTFCCFAIALVVSQLASSRRAAAGIGGVLIVILFLVNSGSRLGGGPEAVRWLSPFWAYERSTPLLRGGSLDATATGIVVASAVVLVIVAALAFRLRDVAAPLFRWRPRAGAPLHRPSRDTLLRLPVLGPIRQQRAWIVGWAIGLSALATFLIAIMRSTVDALLQIPTLRAYFDRLGATGGYETFLSTIWGSTALLLLSIYAIAQVSAWVGDDAEGRAEVVLAQPVSRTRVVLERLVVLSVGSALVIALASVVVLWNAWRLDIALQFDRFATGSALMITVPLAFGSIGAVMSGWRPRLAVPALTAVAIASYFTQQLGPLFDWPDWLTNASVYSLYGTPIATGVEWGGILILMASGLVATAIGVAAMQRRDIGA